MAAEAMRRRGKVDRNHADIIDALRKVGATAFSAAPLGRGAPDIIAGLRGVNVLLEVKATMEPSDHRPAAQLQPDQVTFAEKWAGTVRVVTSPEEAVLAVIEAARQAGAIPGAEA